MPVLAALCKEIEEALGDTAFSLTGWLHLLILSAALAAFGTLLRQYFCHRILVHGNLLLLFANVLLIYFFYILGQFVYVLRYKILVFTYQSPCELVTPLWMVACFYGPAYLHSLGYPAFHFCVMVERWRATKLAAKYEREGQGLGRWMVAGIWCAALGYMAFVVWAAFSDEKMAQVQGLIYLTSERSGPVIIYVNYFALGLVIVTAFCDWRITSLNTRIRVMSKKSGRYSLSRNFQLNENMLAMRLILPLDTVYALLYTVFTVLVIILRSYRPLLTNVQYANYYNFINTLLYVYATVCLCIYIRFLRFVSRCQRRRVNPDKTSEMDPAKVHFNQLNAQWKKRQSR